MKKYLFTFFAAAFILLGIATVNATVSNSENQAEASMSVNNPLLYHEFKWDEYCNQYKIILHNDTNENHKVIFQYLDNDGSWKWIAGKGVYISVPAKQSTSWLCGTGKIRKMTWI